MLRKRQSRAAKWRRVIFTFDRGNIQMTEGIFTFRIFTRKVNIPFPVQCRSGNGLLSPSWMCNLLCFFLTILKAASPIPVQAVGLGAFETAHLQPTSAVLYLCASNNYCSKQGTHCCPEEISQSWTPFWPSPLHPSPAGYSFREPTPLDRFQVWPAFPNDLEVIITTVIASTSWRSHFVVVPFAEEYDLGHEVSLDRLTQWAPRSSPPRSRVPQAL